jgi:hypothetical protein
MAQEVKDQAVNKSKDFEAAMQKFFNKNNIWAVNTSQL